MKEVLNEIWNGEAIPEKWEKEIVVPIFKEGHKDEGNNSNGHRTQDLRRTIEEKIRDGVGGKEDPERYSNEGFRKKKGTMEAIYVLKTAVEEEHKYQACEKHYNVWCGNMGFQGI